MSRRKHKKRNESSSNENRRNPQQQRMNQPPFGINPAQLLSMLGNVDMNQINSMLQSMNKNGIDFNNFNLGNLQNMMGNMGQKSFNGNMNNSPNDNMQHNGEEDELNNNIGSDKKKNKNKTYYEDKHEQKYKNHIINDDDENMELLKYFRNILAPDKVVFIDKIIKLYKEGAFEE